MPRGVVLSLTLNTQSHMQRQMLIQHKHFFLLSCFVSQFLCLFIDLSLSFYNECVHTDVSVVGTGLRKCLDVTVCSQLKIFKIVVHIYWRRLHSGPYPDRRSGTKTFTCYYVLGFFFSVCIAFNYNWSHRCDQLNTISRNSYVNYDKMSNKFPIY